MSTPSPRTRIITLAALATLAATPSRAMNVQAHRGGRGYAPENSMVAFRQSIELGISTLELDLQVTRDRVIVVNHDAELGRHRCRGLDRLSTRMLSSLDADDLDDVRCGGEPLARLDDVLDLASGAPHPVGLNVEIKNQDGDRGLPVGDIARLVVDALARHGALERAIVQSFDPSAIRAVRELAPRLGTAILARDRDDYARLLDETGATILSPRANDLTREDVERCHRRGVAVIPWVVNDPEDAKRLASWGVDAVISDRPDLLLGVLDPNHRSTRREAQGGNEAMRTKLAQPIAAAAMSIALAAAAPPLQAAERALDLRDVRIVAVYPFTSGGNIDTFCTSLFVQEIQDRKLFNRIVDPYELSITIPDGEPFQAQPVLGSLLEEARGKGADAILVGEGKWYDWGFRIEARLIEVSEGRVVWQCALRSGMMVSGPAAKKELARKATHDLAKARK